MTENNKLIPIPLSELPLGTSIDNLISIGVDASGKSVKVPIAMLKGNKGDTGTKGDTGEDGNNIAYKVVYNVSQANNKYDYTASDLARLSVPANLRGLGQIITYRLHTGNMIMEQFTGDKLSEWSVESNWEKLHSAGGGVELIPYSSKGNSNSGGYALYYLNQSALISTPFNRIRAYFTKTGTLTVTVATGIPNNREIVKSWTLNIGELGEQIITLPEEIKLTGKQFVGFGSQTDTANFKVNTAIMNGNPVGGGYVWFGSSSSPGSSNDRDMNVGIISSADEIDNNRGGNKSIYNVSQADDRYDYTTNDLARAAVPTTLRTIGQIIIYRLHTGRMITEQFTGDNLSGWLTASNWKTLHSVGGISELIPYLDKGSGHNAGYALYYLNQSVLIDTPFNRIRAYFTKIGTLTITVATGIPASREIVKSWTLNIGELGEQIITLPEEIKLIAGQFVGLGSQTDTANFRVNTGPTVSVGGGYAWFGGANGYSDTRNLNVGIIASTANIEDEESAGGSGTSEDTSLRGFNRAKEAAVQALSKKTGGLASIKKSNMFSFIQFSDAHGNVDQIKRVFDAINGYLTIPFGINCGDIVGATISDDFQTYQNIALASNKVVYHVLGNHDLFNGTTPKANVKFMQPFWSKWGVEASAKNYYYKDISGVRFIFMDEYESQKSGDHNRYFSNAQLAWLIDTLKSATKAIIVTHQPPGGIVGTGLKKPSGEIITGLNDFFDNCTDTIIYSHYSDGDNPVRDIVEAWKQGTSLVKTYTASDLEKNVINVTFTGKKEFICYFTGHEHYDKFGFVENTTQLSCTVSCTTLSDAYSDIPRVYGTISQDCINAVGVNTDDKTVSLVRLGSDVAYDQRERKSICVIYDKDKY